MWLLFCSLCLKKHETSLKMAGSGSDGVSFLSLSFIGHYETLKLWDFFLPLLCACVWFFFHRQKNIREAWKSIRPSVAEGFSSRLLFVILINKDLCYLTIWPRSNEDESTVAFSINPILHVSEIHSWYPLRCNIKQSWWDDHGACSASNAFLEPLSPFAFLRHTVSHTNAALLENIQCPY